MWVNIDVTFDSNSAGQVSQFKVAHWFPIENKE